MKTVRAYSRLPKTILLILPLLLVAVSAVKINPDQVMAAPDSALYFDPSARSISTGQNFTLDARINPGSNEVTAVDLQVTFDQSRLRLDSISTADSPFSVTLQAASINNNNGTASIVVGVPTANPPAPVTADSKIATFTFTGIGAAANSQTAFASGSVAAAIGESGDVLTSRTGAAVTITGATYGLSDFATLVQNWLQTVAGGREAGNVNGDAIVNTRDLGIMMSSWAP